MERKGKKSTATSVQNGCATSTEASAEACRESIDWKKEISSSLEWINVRSWPLGVGVLAIAVLYMYYYSVDSHVSLSIANPAVIAALPVMLILIVYAEIILVLTVMLPVGVLFTPFRKDGSMPYHLFVCKTTAPSAWKPFLTWMIAPVVITILFFIILIFAPKFSSNDAIILISLLLTVYLVIEIAAIWWLAKAKGQCIRVGDISWGFMILLAVAALVQLLYITSITKIAAHYAKGMNFGLEMRWQTISIIIITVLAMMVVCVIQWAGIKIYIYNRMRPNFFRSMALAIGLVPLLITILPPVGASFAAFAFQAPASGNRGCIVFEWSTSASKKQILLDKKNSQHSKPLRILVGTGDTYQVRLFDRSTPEESEKVWFIPHSDVSAMMSCSKHNNEVQQDSSVSLQVTPP